MDVNYQSSMVPKKVAAMDIRSLQHLYLRLVELIVENLLICFIDRLKTKLILPRI